MDSLSENVVESYYLKKKKENLNCHNIARYREPPGNTSGDLKFISDTTLRDGYQLFFQ